MAVPEQYRLLKEQYGWRVLVTWGLLQTEYLRVYYRTARDAREAAKQHAATYGNTTPIIVR